MNCCLFNVGDVLSGGFEMGNVWYNEPKTLDTAFDVMGDIILSTAAQQYGGFTVPEVDKILAPYAEKSFRKKRNTSSMRIRHGRMWSHMRFAMRSRRCAGTATRAGRGSSIS